MKRILSLFLLLACSVAHAQFTPGQVLTAAQLNSQFSLYVPIAGGTLTGPLTVPSLSVTGSPIPLASGGTGAATASAALAALGGLPIGGGTLTGPLTVPSLSTGPVTGSVTTSGTVPGVQVDNIITCTDTQGLTGAIQIKDCYKSLQSFGGSNVTGNRQAIEGYGLLTAPTAPGSVFRARYYVGGSFTSEAQAGDNGFATTLNGGVSSGATSIVVTSASGMATGATLNITLATPVNGSSVQQTTIQNISGATITISPALNAAANNGAAVVVSLSELQGAIFQSVTDSGANYFDAVIGAEANITAIGLAPRIKTWLGVGNNSNDAVAGTQWDAAIGLTSASSSLHATTGILFAPYAGYFPVNTNGALIGAYTGAGSTTPINVADGLDATGINLTTAVVRAQVNSTGIAPSTANPGIAIQDNLTGGSGEIDMVNTYVSAGTTFNVVQKTGASTSSTVFSVAPSGAVFSGVGGFGLPVLTVATLPTCNTAAKGRALAVSDATSPTYNGALTGGGGVSVPVYCNGTSWTSH